jgi:hypothetical protein
MEAGLARDCSGAVHLGAPDRPVDDLTEQNTQAFLMNSYKVRARAGHRRAGATRGCHASAARARYLARPAGG